MNSQSQVWKFFSSVQLAIFTLFTLSLTSIIGTIVPQDRSFDFYVEQYGEGVARFFQVLDIPTMYTSWWFLTLLGLLTINLIVCSIDRFPLAWKQITLDQTGLTKDRLQKMAYIRTVHNSSPSSLLTLENSLKKSGWKVQRKETADELIIAAQKGRWSRTGVYIVHVSILVIFAGAIVGHFFGFKGSVLIPETKETDKVYASKTQMPLNLGFTVRCDKFDIEFYDNGMPKEYTSRLTVLDNDQEVMVKDIEVNHPLQYRGITFYQSSYEGYRDFLITLTKIGDTTGKTFIAPFQQQIQWGEQNITMGIVNAEAMRDRVVRMKVWIKSGQNQPIVTMVEPQKPISLQEHGLPYSVSVKQMYATGLQVAKDPGVWLVYLGCFLMMTGLYIAFFMSHRRLWFVSDTGAPTDLFVAGTTNKNKLGFEKTFTEIFQIFSENKE